MFNNVGDQGIRIWGFMRGYLYVTLAMLTFPPIAVMPMKIMTNKLGMRNLGMVISAVFISLIPGLGMIRTLLTMLPVLVAFYLIELETIDRSAIERIFLRYLKIMSVVFFGSLLFLAYGSGEALKALKGVMLTSLETFYGDAAGKIIEVFSYNFVGMYFFMVLMIFLGCYAAYFASFKYIGESIGEIKTHVLTKRIPNIAFGYMVAALLLSLVKVEPLGQIGNNLLIVFMALYFVQGIFVSYRFVQKNKTFPLFKTRGLRVASLLFFVLMVPYFLVGIGLVDNLFNFWKSNSEDVEKE